MAFQQVINLMDRELALAANLSLPGRCERGIFRLVMVDV